MDAPGSSREDSPLNLDIQVLRAISIIFVLLQHYRNRLPAGDGYHLIFKYFAFTGGVDIFFAISGYVIASSIFRNQTAIGDLKISNREFITFWIRRIFRLYPAALIWVAISVIEAPFVHSVPANEVWLVMRGAIAATVAMSNFFWATCLTSNGIGSTCGNPDFNGVYWSLSLEEQFYLLLSIGLLLFPFKRIVLISCLLALTASFFPAPAFSYLWVLRPQALCVGLLVFAFSRTQHYRRLMERSSRRLRQVAIALGLAVVAAVPVMFNNYSVPFIAIAAGAILLMSTVDGALNVGIFGKCMAWVGERSYSLYLAHLPIFLALREVLQRYELESRWHDWTLAVFVAPLAVAVALLAAAGTYRWIERPLRNFGRTTAARHGWSAVSAAR